MNSNYNNKIIELVCECCYPITTRDFIGTVIYDLYNMDKATSFYKVMKKEDKIIVASYNIKVSFKGKSYDIPTLIQFPKAFPKVAPEVYIEGKQEIGINTKNSDIDPTTRRVNTPYLRSWNLYSTIKGVIDDMQASFNKEFPIYKITSISKPIVNQSQFVDNSNSMMNQDFTLFSENSMQQPQVQPQNNFYSSQINSNFNQSYMNNNPHPPQQHYNNPYYSNSNPSLINSFSNNMQSNPNPLYSSSFNNSKIQSNCNQPFSQDNSNFGSSQISNSNTNNWVPSNSVVLPQTQNKFQNKFEQEIKKKLIEELKLSLESKIKEEIMAIKKQEEVLGNFKKEFLQFSENLSYAIDNKSKAEMLVSDFIINIKDEVAGLRDIISVNESNEIRLDNYSNFIKCKDIELIRYCAVEATIEDFISIIKKSIEKGIYDFQSALKIIREVTKEIIKVRFCREKLQRRYAYQTK